MFFIYQRDLFGKIEGALRGGGAGDLGFWVDDNRSHFCCQFELAVDIVHHAHHLHHRICAHISIRGIISHVHAQKKSIGNSGNSQQNGEDKQEGGADHGGRESGLARAAVIIIF